MLDAFTPASHSPVVARVGALSPAAEQKQLAELTDILLEHEGAYPAVRSIAWVVLHRPPVEVADRATV